MAGHIIEYLKISRLFNTKDVSIYFNDSCTILIGENGIGKTTILSIVNTLVCGDLERLPLNCFESIEIKLSKSDQPFSFSKQDLEYYLRGLTSISSDIEIQDLKRVERIIFSKWRYDQPIAESDIRKVLAEEINLIRRISIPNFDIIGLLTQYFKEYYRFISFKRTVYNLNLDVVYLPTYRRIEADLNRVLNSSLEDDELIRIGRRASRDRYMLSQEIKDLLLRNKMVKFGMVDIEKKIDGLLSKISSISLAGYSKVSGEMIKYLIWEPKQSQVSKLDTNEVSIILARSGDNLSEEDKQKIMELIETGEIQEKQYLLYVLNSLIYIYRHQKDNDTALKNFAKECNNFLVDKNFIYDESRVKFSLYFKNDRDLKKPISLDRLSSGEKQIISMLAKVYLDPSRNIVFLIDEPELSLSIYWQEKFLPSILNAPACKQLIAVTHSPFIFNNELRDFALGSSVYVSDSFVK